MKKIGIIGSGSWGVALAIHLASLGNEVRIWSFMQEEADMINNEKKCKFIPDALIPEKVICTTSYKESIEGTDFILHVTPSKFTRSTLKDYKQYVTNQPVIICSKGFESETLSTLDEIFQQEMPNTKIGVLSGPSHAEEVAFLMTTVLVIASKDKEVQKLIQDTFMCEKMRIYTSNDVKGVELGGALKKHNSILCWSCIRFRTRRQFICSINNKRISRNKQTRSRAWRRKRDILWIKWSRRFNSNMFKRA